MSDATISSLLKKAESRALVSDWQGTIDILEQVLQMDPQHSGANRTIGTILLETGDAGRAVPYLTTSLEAEPDRQDTAAALARALAQTGHPEEAEQILKQLIEIDPDNRSAWNQLAQTLFLQNDRVTEAVQILAALVQSDPTDPEALYMMGKVYESGEDAESAKDLYQQILRHHPDDKRAEVALKDLERTESGSQLPSLLFLGPPVSATQNRLGIPAKALNEDGYPVQVGTSWSENDAPPCDVVVISQPHTNTDFIEAFLHYKSSGKKAYIDLDMHFPSIPENHPLYDTAGPGNPDGLEALEQILDTADGLLVSSQALGEAYEAPGREIHVFPPVWDPDNPLWEKPAEKRGEIHLGLVGSQVLPDDARILVPVLEELFEQHENLKLVVLENFELLDLFEGIDEHRKLFLPASRYEDYPYQLSHIDILLVPGEDTPFNRARSDRPLMEAGIRGIPWVATACPSFQSLNTGGILASSPGEWSQILADLPGNAAERTALGRAGRENALVRTTEMTRKQWQAFILP